jgi:putative hydrolase of HD superfamily
MTEVETAHSQDALLEAFGLKDLARRGWLRTGLSHPESVAAHSWGIALLALLYTPAELDRGRVLAIATVHDLAEAIVGDITPHDGVRPEDKRTRETAAMAHICQGLPHGAELEQYWRDYEDGSTPEGRFVKALDKLDMGLEAIRYARRGLDTTEFLASARRGLAGYPALLAVLEDASRETG